MSLSRRKFLASLFALPAAVKAAVSTAPKMPPLPIPTSPVVSAYVPGSAACNLTEVTITPVTPAMFAFLEWSDLRIGITRDDSQS